MREVVSGGVSNDEMIGDRGEGWPEQDFHQILGANLGDWGKREDQI